jgi:hypothetical protein
MSHKIKARRSPPAATARMGHGPPGIGEHRNRGTERARFAILFGILSVGYLLTFSGSHFGRISDGKEMFATALSIYEFGELRILNSNFGQKGDTQAEIYSRYGLGFPIVLQVPIYLAEHLESWFGYKQGDYLFPLTNLILNLLTSLLIAASARRLNLSWWVAYCASLAFAFGSFAWPYSSYDFSEPLQAFCLVFTFWALIRASAEAQKAWVWLLLAGLAIGFAVLTKTLLVVTLPVFAFYRWQQTKGTMQEKIRSQLLFGSPIGCCGIALAILNHVRFGSVLESGYRGGSLFTTPLWTGLYGLILSPGKGIVEYAPLTLLLPISGIFLYRLRRKEGLFLCLMSLALILPTARWWSWEGGASWGPRLLYPLLPFLMLFSASIIDDWKRIKYAVIALVAAGVIINCLGVLFFFSTWGLICGSNGELLPLNAPGRPQWEYQVRGGTKYFPASVAVSYIPSLSPILGHAWVLRWRYLDIPFPISALLNQPPLGKLPYGPLTINFERLGENARSYPSFLRDLTTAELLFPDLILSRSNALGPYPVRAKAFGDHGDRLVQRKDYARAYHAYRRAYDLGYDTASLLPKLGAICFNQAKFAEGDGYFDQYLQDFPADSNVRLLYAQALEATQQYAKSLEQYTRLRQVQNPPAQVEWIDQRIAALSRILHPERDSGSVKKEPPTKKAP